MTSSSAAPADGLSAPRLKAVSCLSPAGVHRMAYWEWGDPANDHVLLCVHGLTRTGRDFDPLARRLASRYRVVCPDVVGRGASDWLADPAYYAIPQYVADMTTLIAALGARELDWFGTSMGGLIGMTFASMPAAPAGLMPLPGLPARTRVHRLLINDVGPALQFDGLARIGEHLADRGDFASLADAVAYTKRTAASFGPHTDDEWLALARHTYRELDGRWVKHYDPGIAEAIQRTTPALAAAGEQMLWRAFAAIDCPMLLVRGAQSDLFTRETAERMLAANAHARLVEVPGVGHAPSFFHDDQIVLAERFFAGQ